MNVPNASVDVVRWNSVAMDEHGTRRQWQATYTPMRAQCDSCRHEGKVTWIDIPMVAVALLGVSEPPDMMAAAGSATGRHYCARHGGDTLTNWYALPATLSDSERRLHAEELRAHLPGHIERLCEPKGLPHYTISTALLSCLPKGSNR